MIQLGSYQPGVLMEGARGQLAGAVLAVPGMAWWRGRPGVAAASARLRKAPALIARQGLGWASDGPRLGLGWGPPSSRWPLPTPARQPASFLSSYLSTPPPHRVLGAAPALMESRRRGRPAGRMGKLKSDAMSVRLLTGLRNPEPRVPNRTEPNPNHDSDGPGSRGSVSASTTPSFPLREKRGVVALPGNQATRGGNIPRGETPRTRMATPPPRLGCVYVQDADAAT